MQKDDTVILKDKDLTCAIAIRGRGLVSGKRYVGLSIGSSTVVDIEVDHLIEVLALYRLRGVLLL